MEEMIIGIIGMSVGLAGLAVLISCLAFYMTGEKTLGEVVSSRQNDKGLYVHTIKYTASGEERVQEDKVGYSRAMNAAEKLLIIYKKKQPDVFRAASELRMKTIGCAGLAVMGIAFGLRFLVF